MRKKLDEVRLEWVSWIQTWWVELEVTGNGFGLYRSRVSWLMGRGSHKDVLWTYMGFELLRSAY